MDETDKTKRPHLTFRTARAARCRATERHLFYVACTRARDRLNITGVLPISDFVADIGIIA